MTEEKRTKKRERTRRRRAAALASGTCLRCLCPGRPMFGGTTECRSCGPTEIMESLCGGAPRCQCPGCPETIARFLTVDHKENDGWRDDALAGHSPGARGRLGPVARRKDQRENPHRYQVLCFNCNCSKGHSRDGKCPLEGTNHSRDSRPPHRTVQRPAGRV